MEYWDAYDQTVTKTGETLIRGQAIPPGRFHLVVEAIIQSKDGSILFMKRDANKPIYPNYYEASAGGSVLKGEESLVAIKREIFEETGLSISNIAFLGETIKPTEYSVYHNYHATYSGNKESVKLQKNETTDFQWVSLDHLESFLKNHLIIAKQKKLINHYLQTKQWRL